MSDPAPKKYFLCRLLPPRPTFMADLTEAERNVMREHAAYWTEQAKKGPAIVFGPVADPKGGWGVGIVEAASDEEMKTLEQNDPAIRANIGMHYEILPMLRAIVRGTTSAAH
ncbi:MAG: YciI family protein [Myxococcaceae bacterium]